eukprot:gnl/Spiro4/22269_TR10963_c0_g1_i1.p1 gnl/Spiro4/22269_TR10963_c0_g1~~gnl/Spiro4/22269_TR10963_c0_g1_i1.p1  ORF type:complete len:645 (-),score=118.62 gnl/Spiro4/22269_TR10963_c0_g1_i1:64-1800(-)
MKLRKSLQTRRKFAIDQKSRKGHAKAAALKVMPPASGTAAAMNAERVRAMSLTKEERTRTVAEQQDQLADNINSILQLVHANQRDPTKAELLADVLNADSDRQRFFADLPRTIINYNKLLRIQCVQGKKDAFLETLKCIQIEGFQPDQYTYSHLFVGCGVVKDLPLLEGFHRELLLDSARLKPNVKTFGSLVSAYISIGGALALDKAFWVVERDMKDRKIMPNHVIGTSLVHGCMKNRQALRGLDTFDLLYRSGFIDPDPVTYSAIINCCSKLYEAERAVRYFDEMTLRGLIPTQTTFHSIIFCLARRYDKHIEAFKYFEMMKASGYMPTLESYNAVMHACAVAGNTYMAIKIFESMKKMNDPSVLPNELTFQNLFQSLAVGQRGKDVHTRHAFVIQTDVFFREMIAKDIPPTVNTMNKYLQSFTTARRVKSALMIFDSFFAKYGLTPNIETYRHLCEMFAGARRFNLLMKCWDDLKTMKDLQERDTLTVMHGCLKTKNVRKAVDILRESKEECGVAVRNENIKTLIYYCRNSAPALLPEIAEICPPPVVTAWFKPGRTVYDKFHGRKPKTSIPQTGL